MTTIQLTQQPLRLDIPYDSHRMTYENIQTDNSPTKFDLAHSMVHLQQNEEPQGSPDVTQNNKLVEQNELKPMQSQDGYSSTGSIEDRRKFLGTPDSPIRNGRQPSISYIQADEEKQPAVVEEKFIKIKEKCQCSPKIFWLYMTFVCIVGLVSLVIVYSSQTKYSSFATSDPRLFADETLQFWKNKYILEIIITKSMSCPMNFEEGLNYLWPGSNNGCACPYVQNSKVQTYIVRGECNSELLSFNCFDVKPQDKAFIQFWRNGQRICVRRDATNSFFNSTTSCLSGASGQTKCGTGDTAVCIPTGKSCPISYVQSYTANDNIVGTLDSQILQIDSTVQFSFEMGTSHYPVSQFRIDEYSHCEHSTNQQISIQKRGDYVLLNSQRRFCSVNDTRPNMIDSLGEETLYKANPTLWSLLVTANSLPAYPRPSNTYSWLLSSMPYPAWTMSCRDNEIYSMPSVEERFTLVKEKSNQMYLLITTVISIFVVSIVLVVIQIRRRISRSADMEYYKSERFYDPRFAPDGNRFGRQLYPRGVGWVQKSYIIQGVHWLFRILNLPSIILSYSRISSSIDWFGKTVTKSCSDTFYVENIANDYQSSLKQLKDYYSVLLGFWVALFFADILYFAFNYYYEIQPAKEEEQLTDLIVKGGADDKQFILPMRRNKVKTVGGGSKQVGNGEEEEDHEARGRRNYARNNQQTIQEEDDHLYDEDEEEDKKH